ncbi:MAG: FeeE [Patescibacteria group bacterium]|jgi:ABC-type lipoprotein release transport system permease subunit|nr:FeeE [Patescibacteria group bacterium]MDQ5912140.1 FeeE [Patescibacteria group bacterium]MDQ5954291.1 FeeE [Patescibacteria group bacterium]
MKMRTSFSKLKKDLTVGQFLALRELKRNNPWSTALIIFVMSLTFFNMVLMGGILIGLADGMMNSFKTYYSSDILIKPVSQNTSISQASMLDSVIKSLPSYKALSKRYTVAAILENESKVKIKDTEIGQRVSGTLVGINPGEEDAVTGLSSQLISGEFLSDYDAEGIIVGKSLLAEYSKGSSTESRLEGVKIGSRLKLMIGKTETDVSVKGIIDTGNSTVDSRIFILESTMRALTNNQSLNVNEIAILLNQGSDNKEAQGYIVDNFSYSTDVIVETAEETLPKAISDMKKTFSILGNIVGVISLIVGAITIFIVIFVNAITRRKYIGIMKGIGISARAIEISYVIQSLFYALSGILFSSLIIIWFLAPWFDLHPLKFPVTEGKLAITTNGLIIRGLILTVTAFISGYVPAWMVTKQNTLDAILGR